MTISKEADCGVSLLPMRFGYCMLYGHAPFDHGTDYSSETLFVAVLLTFLTQCVDYGKLPHSKSLDQVVVKHCTRKMSGLWSVAIWMYSFFFIWKSVQYFLEIRRLSHVREFFIHLLDIPEQDMQTVSWQDIVARVMALRDQNPKTATNIPRNLRRFIGSQSKERLDAHDIANRLMRKDNYLIAMINKDLLDLSLPAPFMRGRSLLSKTMEWNLQFCILDMAFNELGQVQQDFLRADRRGVLSQKLRQRFFFAGCLNLIFAPVVLAYVVIVYFFTYYNVGALFPPSPFSRNAADTAILRSIRRTPNSRQRASTHDLQNGNSGNSTSFLISSMNALICLYLLRRDMSINSLSA